MKKAILISVTFLYLLVTSGVHMSLHFCHDTLSKISFTENESHCDDLAKKCCKGCDDIHLEFDEDFDQIESSSEISFPNPVVISFEKKSFNLIHYQCEILKDSKIISFYSNTSPPSYPPLYITLCNFSVPKKLNA